MTWQFTAREHTSEVRQAYERVLEKAGVRSRFVDTDDERIHVLEAGEGRPLVLLPGDSSFAAWYLPLMERLDGIRVISPDRAGQGLSDPIDFTPDRYREAAVGWVERLLDALGLQSTALGGHSGGGMWALWFALAHPERVSALTLFAPPALPHTHLPLPLRIMCTPGLGDLVARLSPPSRKSLTAFAGLMGERDTVPRYPDLLDLWVAVGRDPVADGAAKQAFRSLISPYALLSPDGFRRGARAQTGELAELPMPTLLVWGEDDPILGDSDEAQKLAESLPGVTLALVHAGHLPWLAEPERTAAAVLDLVA